MRSQGIAVINRATGEEFYFQRFPASIKHSLRSNYRRSDPTLGTRHLSYENSEPREVSFDNLYLDAGDSNESIAPKLESLEAMSREAERGVPPDLLYVQGSRQWTCVLEDLNYEEVRFNMEGDPTRARVSFTLVERRQVGKAWVTTTEDPEDLVDIIPFLGG